jgi:hypothetical protein
MENFFSWMMKPISHDDVEVWFNINNMIFEKRELFADFIYSLLDIIKTTYLGNEYDDNNETKVILTDEDKLSHFEWCWNKTIENFSKENLKFKSKGEHKDYFEKFFMDLFYNADNKIIRDNINKFFDDLFNENKAFTKSDLDMLTDVYKMLNKNLT